MAVALVQAYLRVNGYFTVSEYPILAARSGQVRQATDLDLLAFRFPGAGRRIPGRSPREDVFQPDPALGCPADRADMLIGEVKEGRAELNRAARDPDVLRTALARFGCCPSGHADVIARLIREGAAVTPTGHRIRFVAFGGSASDVPGVDVTLSLGHVAGFLREHLREHWDVLRHAQFKDPALACLAVLEKAGADHPRGRRP